MNYAEYCRIVKPLEEAVSKLVTPELADVVGTVQQLLSELDTIFEEMPPVERMKDIASGALLVELYNGRVAPTMSAQVSQPIGPKLHCKNWEKTVEGTLMFDLEGQDDLSGEESGLYFVNGGEFLACVEDGVATYYCLYQISVDPEYIEKFLVNKE